MDIRDGIVTLRQEKESRFVYIPGTEPMFCAGETLPKSIPHYECPLDFPTTLLNLYFLSSFLLMKNFTFHNNLVNDHTRC